MRHKAHCWFVDGKDTREQMDIILMYVVSRVHFQFEDRGPCLVDCLHAACWAEAASDISLPVFINALGTQTSVQIES